MAAAQHLSPGGALFRASRMFAVPPPLPQPNSLSGFGSGAGTRQNPIYLTITTPTSSLYKGDWGLKRPLPLRSTTKTSSPLVRVTTMDTFEHVTEFESAADHTLTLRKWQEMYVPLSTPQMRKNRMLSAATTNVPTRSVFEDDIDYTAPRESKPGQDNIRWKYGGPWLAGQTDLEFNEYLRKEVRRRRTDFHDFLREEYVRKHNSEVQEKMRGGEMPEPLAAKDVTEAQFNIYLRELRNDQGTLSRLIRDFLDLPPAPAVELDDRVTRMSNRANSFAADALNGITEAASAVAEPTNPYAFSGPPKTHPSGGLSYLRTSSHIDNHPIFGPQEEKTPVQGRVILPRGAGVGTVSPKLGVAGVVVELPVNGGFNLSNIERKSQMFQKEEQILEGIQYVDPDVPGGSKAWVKVTGANLDSDGRPSLWIRKASQMSELVAQGKGEQAENIPVSFKDRSSRAPQARSESTGGSSAWYGLSAGFEKPHVFGGSKANPISKANAMGLLEDVFANESKK